MNNRSLLLLVSMLLFPGIIGAQSVDTRGLTEEQEAQLALQVAQMKREAQESIFAPSMLDPQELNEWVDLGKNIGMAVTATAKELGVASDTFLQSTTGKITVVLIVWKVIGEDVVDVFGGIAVWLVLMSLILWSFKHFHMSKRVLNKKTGEVSYIRRYDFSSSDSRVFAVLGHVAAFITITGICLGIIF